MNHRPFMHARSCEATLLGLFVALGLLFTNDGSAGAAEPAANAPVEGRVEKISSEDAEFFEKNVRPLLSQHCFECHGEKKQEAGLRLDLQKSAMRGGDDGPVIRAGKPDESKLMAVVRHAGEIKMPPDSKLPAESIEALTIWIQRGAPWPAGPTGAIGDEADKASAAKNHWAFQPVREPAVPLNEKAAWIRTPVDAFILAKLTGQGITPSAASDRRTLIRRATIDLTGLLPTPAEVEDFVNDPSPDSSPAAFDKVIERLLASPRYGERWGRYWLDLARYADTKGYVFTADRAYPFAYVYRDWVIKAFNNDQPYDQFIVEQIAADRLPRNAEENPHLAAMGFLTVGRQFLNSKFDIIDDRIDVLMRTTMGLTVACARCHDHKFDPIPTSDYYSLFGVFDASVDKQQPIAPATEKYLQGVQEREAKVTEFITTRRRETEELTRTHVGTLLYVTKIGPEKLDSKSVIGKIFSPTKRAEKFLEPWKKLSKRNGKSFDPLLAPWFAFAAIPTTDDSATAEFAAAESKATATALATRFNKNDHATDKLNPLVAKLFEGEPPKSLAEVALRYDRLFADVDREWQELLADFKQANLIEPTALPFPESDELRRWLYATDSPVQLSTNDVERYFDKPTRDEIGKLRGEAAKWSSSPAAPLQAMTLVDAEKIDSKSRVLLRGNPGRPGPEVSRQFVSIVAGEGRQPFSQGSGRLELAQAIVTPENPLTARVMVNRIWLHHFGQGLVRTASDFGLRSDPPSHPELLDYLAVQFVRDGWSIKQMHRLMMRSSAYQQSSSDRPDARAKDPENVLVWRMNRRRLDLESMRDSLLFAAGQLEEQTGGPAVNIVTAPFSRRRTVYGQIERQNLPGFFRTFDFATPDTHTAQRFTTTVPQQALYLMNSPFVVEQSTALMRRPEIKQAPDTPGRVRRIYTILYGRLPTSEEISFAEKFVTFHADGKPADDANNSDSKNWQRYAQALLMSNELIFVD